MAVRVKIQIQQADNPNQILEATALLALRAPWREALINPGFETEEPEILIPLAAFQTTFSTLLARATVQTLEAAGGTIIKAYEIKDAVNVRVITEDKMTDFVRCSLIVSEFEKEIIVNDKAIDKLEVTFVSPGAGIWHFKNDNKMRNSLHPQFW